MSARKSKQILQSIFTQMLWDKAKSRSNFQ